MKERETALNKVPSSDWFEDHDVFWIDKERQRQVILNPGRDVVWFTKNYPLKGQLTLKRKQYISDLSRNVIGNIIAVSATNQGGKLKAKPIGTFFELFESEGGYRVWISPKEYHELNKKSFGTKNREISTTTITNNNRPSKIEDEK